MNYRAITQKPAYHLQHWLQRGLALLFPPQCVACRRPGWLLCPHCAQAVEPIREPICLQCGRPQASATKRCTGCRQWVDFPLVMMRVVAFHATPLREAIHALKYDNCPELAESLARYLYATLLQMPWGQAYQEVDCVIPVPLHEARRQERGYNQSELLAQALCRRLPLPLQAAWLVRQRATASQVGLNAVERRANVAEAFVASSAVIGKRVMLIDDVYTTGATLYACANALRAAGATAIYGLALACPR
ncbi:MAG: ComF family protein [Caldilineaceae bacterium]